MIEKSKRNKKISTSAEAFNQAAAGFADLPPEERAIKRIELACRLYGDGLIMSTSFGIQSAVMLHLVARMNNQIPIVFVDTEYLEPDTYRFKQHLTERLSLSVRTYRPVMSAAEQEALRGKLWEQGEEGIREYKLTRKVEPMNRAVQELHAAAWIAGLRRDQSDSRKDREAAEQQRQIVKIYPVIDWTAKDIFEYMKKYDLPYHPHWDRGVTDVGDWHSPKNNDAHRECGLHDTQGVQRPEGGNGTPDFQI